MLRYQSAVDANKVRVIRLTANTSISRQSHLSNVSRFAAQSTTSPHDARRYQAMIMLRTRYHPLEARAESTLHAFAFLFLLHSAYSSGVICAVL